MSSAPSTPTPADVADAYSVYEPRLRIIPGVWGVSYTVDRLLVYVSDPTALNQIPDHVLHRGKRIPIQVIIANRPKLL